MVRNSSNLMTERGEEEPCECALMYPIHANSEEAVPVYVEGITSPHIDKIWL
jgi:hypothetical protein